MDAKVMIGRLNSSYHGVLGSDCVKQLLVWFKCVITHIHTYIMILSSWMEG